MRKTNSPRACISCPGFSPVSVLLLTFLILFQNAHAQQQGSSTEPSPATVSAASNVPSNDLEESWYRIGPGDVLDVRVFNRPQLAVTVRVNEQGIINLPLLGDTVEASCRTERELARQISLKYVEKKFLKVAQVDVFIKEYQASPVTVIGAVNSPGRFQLQRRMRMLDLLMMAGGPSTAASSSVQVVHTAPASPCDNATAAEVEPTDDGQSVVSVRLADILRANERVNTYVRPGDIVMVAANPQAIVLGNVLKPGPIAVDETTTLSNALALAGGTLPNSKSEVRIRRQAAGTTSKTELVVNVAAIRKRQADDVLLQGGDIVEVSPSSGGVGSVLKGLVRGLIPSISNLPVHVIRPY